MGDNIDKYEEDAIMEQTPKSKKVSAKHKMASIENVKKAQAALQAKRAAKKEEKRKELVEEVIKDKKYEEAIKELKEDMRAIHSQFEKFILTQEKAWVAKDKKALNKDKEVIKQLKYLNL